MRTLCEHLSQELFTQVCEHLIWARCSHTCLCEHLFRCVNVNPCTLRVRFLYPNRVTVGANDQILENLPAKLCLYIKYQRAWTMNGLLGRLSISTITPPSVRGRVVGGPSVERRGSRTFYALYLSIR